MVFPDGKFFFNQYRQPHIEVDRLYKKQELENVVHEGKEVYEHEGPVEKDVHKNEGPDQKDGHEDKDPEWKEDYEDGCPEG